jgi:Zn-dependent M16 (insulinase) family peptidase
MYQALITSGLGAQYAPGTGYYFYKDGTFSVGLSDISAASVDTIEKTIYETIKKAHAEGFPQERIDSLLHQIELDTKHVDTEVGVNIGSIVTQYWAHGVSPIAVLKLSEYLDRLRRELASGRKVFQDLIEKYLINNQHRLTLTMKPSESYLSDQVKAEEKDLMKLAPYFKGKAGMQLRKIAKTLRDRQSAPPRT